MGWLNHPIDSFKNTLFPNPAKDAMGYLDQIPGQIKPYYDPYINAGGRQLGNIEGEFGKLINDPNEIIRRIGSGYKQSPGYDWKVQQGQQGVNNAQAAGGMVGTPQHEQESAQMLEGIASQDYNDYMKNALGLYGTGLSGEQDIMHQGYNASSSLADQLAQVLAGKSGLSYAGQANQNNMTGNLLNAITQYLSSRK
jgi:hypothetical protein